VAELAKRVIDLTGSRSRLVYRPLPHDDPTRRCPDIALAKRQLNWEPIVSLDEGLKKTIEYFDRELSKAKPASAVGAIPLRPVMAASSES
jgi:UDP-glucuronate decarboxylase